MKMVIKVLLTLALLIPAEVSVAVPVPPLPPVTTVTNLLRPTTTIPAKPQTPVTVLVPVQGPPGPRGAPGASVTVTAGPQTTTTAPTKQAPAKKKAKGFAPWVKWVAALEVLFLIASLIYLFRS